MKLTAREFLDQEYKSITLIGMSGAGKSYISSLLETEGWYNYSCDCLMGAKYLTEIADTDIAINTYIGRLGSPVLGGIALEEFTRRQTLHYDAECGVLRDVQQAIGAHPCQNFVNDSSGSLCELEGEDVIAEVGKRTLFVYLKTSQGDHAELLARALENPKSLYFPPDFLEDRLSHYMDAFDVAQADDIDPDEFLRWVFPFLFEARLPKYQRIADAYGVTISSSAFQDIDSEAAFLDIVANALDAA